MDRAALALRSQWVRLALAGAAALALLVPATDASAHGSEREPIFKGPVRVGGWGGPALKGTTFGAKGAGLMFAGEGGIILGHRLLIGATAATLVSPLYLIDSAKQTERIHVGYGALKLGLIFARFRYVDLSISGAIGMGEACVDDRAGNYCVEDTRFFMAEPEAGLRINFKKWFRVGLFGGYRLTASPEWYGTGKFHLNGFTGTLALEFGSF